MIRRTVRQLIMTSEWPSSAATLKLIQESVRFIDDNDSLTMKVTNILRKFLWLDWMLWS